MKRMIFLLAFLFTAAYFAFSSENNSPNLVVPSNLDAGHLELDILHRFYDPLNGGRIDDIRAKRSA
jgi:hypothetical protein